MEDKKTILDLYYKMSEEVYEVTPEIKKILKETIEITDKLRSTLTEEQKRLLDKVIEKESERGEVVGKQIFVKAFSFATKLFEEGLKEEKSK